MNRQTVINKFIEKAGPLDPKPKYQYVQGSIKGWYGLTTKLQDVTQMFRRKYWIETKKISEVSVKRMSEVLPYIHREIDGWSYDFDNHDILNCARMLQNSPFKDIKVIIPGDVLPIAFNRPNCDISVLLAPIMCEIPKETEQKKILKKFKFYTRWVSPLPDTTYWVVEVPTRTSTELIIKCKRCGNEKSIPEWKSLLLSHHPSCYCLCDTYGDECGCKAKRDGQRYDRIKRQYTQQEEKEYNERVEYTENIWKPLVKANPQEYLYWHEREVKFNGFPYWLTQ